MANCNRRRSPIYKRPGKFPVRYFFLNLSKTDISLQLHQIYSLLASPFQSRSKESATITERGQFYRVRQADSTGLRSRFRLSAAARCGLESEF